MPWLNTNPELMNAIKDLKNNFLRRLSLDNDSRKEIEIFKDEDVSVKTRCLTYMILYQDCLEQTNNDPHFCKPYYKLFFDCKHKNGVNLVDSVN